MEEKTFTTSPSGDHPLKNPGEDKLGYAPFAKHLADALNNASLTEGFVTAIYGEWGAGKSTILNFIEYYLNDLPDDQRPTVVYFNPWWFSGQEDLTRRFFTQVSETLSKRGKVAKAVIEALNNFATVVSDLPPAIHLLADVLPWTKAAKTTLTTFKPQQKDVADLKSKLECQLEGIDHRIIIFIDDIDRLTTEEIRQVFRLIKAVGNFPNVAYVLAFDKGLAAKALNQVHVERGEEYLEKIIQVPFDLPIPDRVLLHSLLFAKLDLLIADTPDEYFDQSYWTNIYVGGLDAFIETPRDITRLANTLAVTYPVVKNEVNPVDFLAIEFIRVFAPDLYNTIRRNPEKFAGPASESHYRAGERNDQFHEEWLQRFPASEQDRLKRLMMRLFPRLAAIWANTYYTHAGDWRRNRRVCSLDVFPVYFRLTVPVGSMSRTEILSILATTRDTEEFGASLLELGRQMRPDGKPKVRTFLEYLEDYTDNQITEDSIPSIIEAFFSVGDTLIKAEGQPTGFYDFGLEVHFGRVTRQLLLRLTQERRFALLQEAFRNANSIYEMVRQIGIYNQEHGRMGGNQPSPNEQQTVSIDQLNQLQTVALQRIKRAADDGTLVDAPHLPRILFSWREWGDVDEVLEWVRSITADDRSLVWFLSQFLQQTRAQVVGEVAVRLSDRLNPKLVSHFLDIDEVARRLERLRSGYELDSREARAVHQFLVEYQLLKEGKNTDDPFFDPED